MWYPPSVTQAAANEPVELNDVKLRLHVDGTDDDTVLTSLIKEARSRVEATTSLKLVTQAIAQKCDVFSDLARLQYGPLQSVTSITYVDVDGQTQALDTGIYEARADGIEASIVLKYGQSWPSIQPGSRITVTAVVGYQEAIEPVLTGAVMALVATWYAFREQVVAGVSLSALPNTIDIDSLLANHRLGA